MDSTWDCLQLILLESWTNWIYLRLHSVDVILGLNHFDFTWDCIQFRQLSIYLMLLSKKLFFCLSHLGMNQIEKYRQNLEVTLVIFIQHSYQIIPNLLCTFDALLMHFWCTFDALSKSSWTFWKCIKSASKVHQKFIKNALKAHQKFIKFSSKLHQKLISTSRIQFLWGRFAEHILDLQLWFTDFFFRLA